MPIQSPILEGTWDEIATHAEQLRAYKKLRLFVSVEETEAEGEGTNKMDQTSTNIPGDEAEQQRMRQAAMRLLEEADKIKGEPGIPYTDSNKAAVGRLIEEKYRRMGLNI